MNVRQLIDMVSKYPMDMHCDVDIGGCLVPVTGCSYSGECSTGLKLELGKQCEVCKHTTEEELSDDSAPAKFAKKKA